MERRERIIRRWFDMWLQGKDIGIEEIFTPDCVYVESWGPSYGGCDRVVHWFQEWNTRGRVTAWEIKQFFHKEDQTAVEWFFRCEMSDRTVQSFDGMSLIRWTTRDQILNLKEFGCNIDNYDPYASGPRPQFHPGSAAWF